MKAIRKKRNICLLLLCFTMLVGMIAFPLEQAVVKAEESTNVEETTEETEITEETTEVEETTEETEMTEVPKEPETDPNEVYKNIKKYVDEELLEDIEWAEAVVEKNSKPFGKPIWFSKEYKKWNIPITKWKDGHYVVNIYQVDNAQEEYWAEDSFITSVEFTIGKVSYKSFSAKSSIGK